MTSRLKFRNLDVEPSAPVSTWPDEGVQAALERGSLSDWARLAAAIRSDPWGEVARAVERVFSYSRPYGSGALLRNVIDQSRAQARLRARAEVIDELRQALDGSGLTRTEFASRLGTSAPRLSTYLSGKVSPSAEFLVRARHLANAHGRRGHPG